jgi:ribosome-binding factor A
MTSDKRKRAHLLAHCDELRDDDGVDPRTFFKPASDRSKQTRKTGQLCRQVAETLNLVLGSQFDDPELINLQVAAVSPAPDSSRLLVTVVYDGALYQELSQDLQARLVRVAGRLRAEVAASITRKRAPQLSFRVIGKPDGEAPA